MWAGGRGGRTASCRALAASRARTATGPSRAGSSTPTPPAGLLRSHYRVLDRYTDVPRETWRHIVRSPGTGITSRRPGSTQATALGNRTVRPLTLRRTRNDGRACTRRAGVLRRGWPEAPFWFLHRWPGRPGRPLSRSEQGALGGNADPPGVAFRGSGGLAQHLIAEPLIESISALWDEAEF